MCGSEQVVISTPKNVQFENVRFFIKVSDEEKFLLFQHGEITGISDSYVVLLVYSMQECGFIIISIQIGQLRYVNEV